MTPSQKNEKALNAGEWMELAKEGIEAGIEDVAVKLLVLQAIAMAQSLYQDGPNEKALAATLPVTRSKRGNRMREVRIVVRVDINELVERIEDDLNQDQLFEFVKKLDETVQDWDFTHRLIKHFSGLLDLYTKEVCPKIEEPEEVGG